MVGSKLDHLKLDKDIGKTMFYGHSHSVAVMWEVIYNMSKKRVRRLCSDMVDIVVL